MDAIVEQWKVYKITSSRRWGHNVYEVSNFGRVRVNGELINFNSYKLDMDIIKWVDLKYIVQ